MYSLNGANFDRLIARLVEKANVPSVRAVSYVALGDSVTQGCMEYEVVEHQKVYHQFFRSMVEQKYPQTILNVINSGVGGETLVQSRVRWERDLFLYNPDLVTIAFGLNDAHAGEKGLAAFVQTLEELIVQIKTRCAAELLVFTPGMMVTQNNPNIHINHHGLLDDFLAIYQAGYIIRYRDAVLGVAQNQRVHCLDVYGIWEELEASGADINLRLANGLNHPDREFHYLVALKMKELILPGV